MKFGIPLEQGEVKTYTVADPGAGFSFTYTVPTNVVQLVTAVKFHYTTNAVASNRRVTIYWQDTVPQTILQIAAPNDAVASNAYDYYYAIGFGDSFENTTALKICVPLPINFYLYPGYTVRSQIGGMTAGDAITSIVLRVQEWIKGD